MQISAQYEPMEFKYVSDEMLTASMTNNILFRFLREKAKKSEKGKSVKMNEKGKNGRK